jgi:hypothetical protein
MRSQVPSTTELLIDAQLERLERQHGQTFVRHALGDLAAARHGLAEDELLAMLPEDALARQDLHKTNPDVNSFLGSQASRWSVSETTAAVVIAS